MQVEIAKALVGEGGRRTQFAGAERGQRPARRLDVFCDLRKALRQRQSFVKAYPLDFVAGTGSYAAGILKYGRNETVVAGGKVARRHRAPSSLRLE